ncbi:RHS repeat-associated core domain-containing protein [Pseudomonas frederiksbergensis]|uniref:RHS repeat-associated core domain-containing protein n=1 Tax=Pseudomonas frederiksbergensis TaxID=104087 RepID=UPI003D1F399A
MDDPTPIIDRATRLASGGLYSQASNFLSHVSTGVDSRTGQFTLGAKLPGLQANALAGPVVAPTLHFSPLASHTDFGFGLGWQLGVSTLDLNTNRISLSTGEQFRLDRHKSDFSDGGLLAFHDQKLRSFVVRQIGINGRTLRVEHKSGDTEWLEVQERSGLAMVVQMRSPQGRQAFLKWISRGNNQFGLQTVWDERGPDHPLLTIEMSRESAVFIAFPKTDREAVFTLQIRNGRLTDLVLPDGDSRWTFGYLEDRDSGLLFPNSVLGPLGSEDTVQYATGNQGHRLPPGAPLAWLPRIISHRHAPGAGQPEIYRHYTWVGTSNFLGGDVAPPGGWQDGTDNLYRMSNYSYTSIETVLNAKGETLATARRTWNRFHLQTDELMTRYSVQIQAGVAVQQQKIIAKKTIYGDDPQQGWENQPAWCQLPVVTITRNEDGLQPPREVREETDYDDYGNALEKRYADGRVETSTYYPLGGGDGCPDDGGQFIRWVKTRTLTPATVAGGGTGGALATQSRYRYALLPRRQSDDIQNLVAHQETAVALSASGEQPVGHTEQIWNTDAASPFFGQPIQSTNILNGLATTSRYEKSLDARGLTEIETRTGYDGLAVVLIERRDPLTGLTVSEVNEHGVETAYAFDKLGRVIRRTLSKGSDYEVSGTCQYYTAGLQRNRTVMVEETDITGQIRRLVLDGSGRPVREECRDVDITGENFREVWAGIYDHDGNLQKETVLDWFPDQVQPISLTTTYELDGWGQTSVVHQPDGVSRHTTFDPITLVGRQWQVSATGERNSEIEIQRNLAGEVEKVIVRAPGADSGAPGSILRTESWTFDGLNRPISHRVDADGQVTMTLTEYDVFGRTTSHTREDGSVIRWRYAMHSDGDLPASISLTALGEPERLLGEQFYDSLGRPTERRTGGQTQTLSYLKGQIPPASSTAADGRLLNFRYEPQLNDALTTVTLGAGNDLSSYTYLPPHGYLTEIKGGTGVIKREYSQAGRVVGEHWIVGGETQTSRWRRSLGGRDVSFTDVDGTQHQIRYDEVGRPYEQQAGNVTVSLCYDSFGRLNDFITNDTLKGRSLHQTLAYDGFDREISRVLEESGSDASRRVIQTVSFNGRDQVTSRRWEQGSTLRSEEHYRYDSRGRLIQSTASGPDAPLDKRTGRRIIKQVFTLNALDGYQRVETTYVDDSINTMAFSYDPAAPDRPLTITHRGVMDNRIELIWDQTGRLIEEKHDGVVHRKLEWGGNGRLSKVVKSQNTSQYRYDPLGRLGEQDTDAVTTRRFYAGDYVVNEHGENGERVTFVRAGRTIFAESRLSQTVRTVLLTGTDGQESVRLESGNEQCVISYTAHGSDDGAAQSRAGFAGELRDLATGLYHLGSYRPYDPGLMLFLAPDSASPFGEGGLNRYAYCGGDPVNRVDPDGHSFWSWIAAGVGIVLGAAAAVVTFGALAPLAGAIAAASLGAAVAGSTVSAAVVGSLAVGAVAAVAVTAVGVGTIAGLGLEAASLGTGLAVPALAATGNEEAASVLGWVSLGTGLAAAVVAIAPAAAQSVSKFGRFVGRWQSNLQNAGGKPNLARSMSVGSRPVATLESLPDVPMAHIVRNLPGTDLKNLSLTSRHMNGMVEANTRPLHTVLPTLADDNRAKYVSKIRDIWRGKENGVLPSQLKRADIDISMNKTPMQWDGTDPTQVFKGADTDWWEEAGLIQLFGQSRSPARRHSI